MLKIFTRASQLANLAKTGNTSFVSAYKTRSRPQSFRNYEEPNEVPIPPRPFNLKDEEFPVIVESTEDFKYVLNILPNPIASDPPKHDSYPTPSGWVPPFPEKAAKLPYYVLRTRFHHYGIFPIVRDGTRKLTRVKYIQGDIWEFDKDLRSYIEKRLVKDENKELKIYSQVNELQRQVLVKGHYEEYVSDFFKECGF